MDKAYNEIVFRNNQSPDLDETNMNAISHGLSVVDDRVIELMGDLTALGEMNFTVNGADKGGWESGHTIVSTGQYGVSSKYSATPAFYPISAIADTVKMITGAYEGLIAFYRTTDQSSFINRTFVQPNRTVDFAKGEANYFRLAVQSTNPSDGGSINIYFESDFQKTIESIENLYGARGYLAESTDVNDIIQNGAYAVVGSLLKSYVNIPNINEGGMLCVNATNDAVYQLLITAASNVIYTRYRISNGQWYTWKRQTPIEEVTTETRYDSVGAMVDIAESYFNQAYDKNNQLVYTSTHGLFTDVVDEEGIKAIVCSQFVEACMNAITYENSRYVSGYSSENKRLWWGFQSDGTGVYYGAGEPYYQYAKDYMRASELYNYFERKGILHPFNVDHNDLKAGDICFYLKSTWEPEIKGTPSDYISHCTFCLRPYKTRYTVMHSSNDHTRYIDKKEAGLMVDEWTYVSTPPTAYVHLEDIPIQPARTKSKIVADKDFNKSGEVGQSTVWIDAFYFTEYLPKGFYTINIESEGDCDAYIRVYYDDSEVEAGITIPTQYREAENLGGKTSIVIYAELPITRIDVRVKNGTHYHIGKGVVYKGYHNADI